MIPIPHVEGSLGSCNKCGDCCELIPFVFSPEESQAKLISGELTDINVYNLEFVLKNWTVLDRETYSEQYKEMMGGHELNARNLYSCNMFDRETRTCMAHDTRPAICSGYPWYDGSRPPDANTTLFKNCGYWEAIPVEIRKRVA